MRNSQWCIYLMIVRKRRMGFFWKKLIESFTLHKLSYTNKKILLMPDYYYYAEYY